MRPQSLRRCAAWQSNAIIAYKALVCTRRLTLTCHQIAGKFNGCPKRLTALQAADHYWAAGGRLLGLASLAVFAVTQTARIIGDWWIR